MRFSRPCYDKPHRCPGWAGGGRKYAQTERCDGGSIRTHNMRIYQEDGRTVVGGGYPGEHPWRFGRCTDCDVITWPYNIRKLDPMWWIDWRIPMLIDKIKWSWDSYHNHGETLRRILVCQWNQRWIREWFGI